MNTSGEFLEKARMLKEEMRSQLNQKSLRYHYHEADVSVLEGVLARGDRRIGAFWKQLTGMARVLTHGQRAFVRRHGEQAFRQCGVDPGILYFKGT